MARLTGAARSFTNEKVPLPLSIEICIPGDQILLQNEAV
jgi:hypothetical protein